MILGHLSGTAWILSQYDTISYYYSVIVSIVTKKLEYYTGTRAYMQ